MIRSLPTLAAVVLVSTAWSCSSTTDASPSPSGEGDASSDGAADAAAVALDASGDAHLSPDGSSSPTPRDWTAHPAIADVPAPATLYALSDIHGGYDRAAALLAANGVLAPSPSAPSAAQWTGGAATLVVVGDMVDKGPQALEVIDLLMALEAAAPAQGGRVIVTLGNHEAELFVDPMNSKAAGPDGIDVELQQRGIAVADFASGKEPRGAWLRLRPFGARVGGWFFAHAGDTSGASVTTLESTLEAALKAHPNFDDPAIVGATSLLESRNWFASKSVVTQNATALGVKHVVMGHDPNALGAKGAIASAFSGLLTRVDCGLSPLVNDSTGKLLKVTTVGGNDVAVELDAAGASRSLFTAPQ